MWLSASIIAFSVMIGFIGLAISLIAVLSWMRQDRQKRVIQLETRLIEEHLALLPDNNHLINWYQTRHLPVISRQLTPHLPELYPGALILPLRPQDTLLYADSLSEMNPREIELLQTKPIRTLAS